VEDILAAVDPEDNDLLNDAIIENQQTVEMTDIYREIIDGTGQYVLKKIGRGIPQPKIRAEKGT
jgi:hypothetical protein